MQRKDTIDIFSVKISTLDKNTLISNLCYRLKSDKKSIIFTPNTQVLLAAKREPRLRALLASSTVNIPDGIGVCLAAKIKHRTTLDRISGIDIAENIMRICAKRRYRIFLLGGRSGVAALAAKKLKQAIPDIKICGTHHGYFQKSGKDNNAIIRKISSSRADVLFVCFGFPMQERWIAQNADALSGVRLFMGLGGSLDVWSGKRRRAPVFFQKAGLEWLWRVALEPRRAKIFLDAPRFLFEICKEE